MLPPRPPRRSHRRLLLPPGWVALGFLLQLGCVALGTHWRQLQVMNVVQVTMPALHPASGEYYPCQIRFTLQYARQQVRQIPYWQTLVFTGRSTDSLVARQVRPAVISLKNSLQQRRGLAIRLAPATRYKHLVFVLDLLAQQDIKKYYFDNHQVPFVVYALSNRFLPNGPCAPMR